MTPRQKRGRRNPGRKVSRRPKNRMDISFAGVHPLVQEHWETKKTLKQNYTKLGLISSLSGMAGGSGAEQALKLASMAKAKEMLSHVEFRVKTQLEKPLQKENDETISVDLKPLESIVVDKRALRIGQSVSLKNDVAYDSLLTPAVSAIGQSIIAQMEAEAANTVPLIRKMSDQESQVLEALYSKHGDDFIAMAKDHKLNRYQFSSGQLRKKFAKLSASL